MFRGHALIVRRAKIVLYSLWYRHTETSEWSKITKIIKIIKIQFYKYHVLILTLLVLQPAKRHHQISATAKTPTHNELRTRRPMW